ncbi:MAG: hypothetical protein IPK83_12110 [Planctomycetes bacterium]|nr:hypothetical protein [Planctomycetota bacterium]
MKKHAVSLAVAITALCISSVTTQATILVNENFNREDGNLVGTNPTPGPGGTWATHSGATGPVQIVDNTIYLSQNASTIAAEDVNVSTGGAMEAGDRLYAGFDVIVEQPGSSISNVYFAHFLQGSTNFTSRLWVTAPTASGFRLALSNDNSITDADGEVFTGDLALGTTYRVVISYDFTGQNGSLWIDQALESGSSITAADPGFSNAVSAFAFRQGSPSGSLTTTQTIDNLCVGTNYGEAYTCVPEPATLSCWPSARLL